MPQPLKVLLVEDNAADAELLVRELRRAGFGPHWQRVDTEAAYLAQLNGGLDLVISDYGMPQFSGLRALELLKQSGRDVPFILVSGSIGEETAVAAMKLGAADYLLKDRLTRLGAAVTQAMAKNRLRREQRQSAGALLSAEAQLGQLLEHSPAVLYVLKLEDEKIIPYLVSQNITALLGFTVGEASSHAWWLGQLHPDDSERVVAGVTETIATGASQSEYRLRHKDGHYCWVNDARRLIRDADGAPAELIGVWTDISARKRAEETVRQASGDVARGRKRQVRLELAILVATTVAVFLLAARFDWFEAATRWILANEIDQLDETILTTIFFATGLALFAFRRWRETESELTTRHQAQAALELLHDELERRVRQRTGELGVANQALKEARVAAVLREGEQRYSFLADTVPQIIWTALPDGRLDYYNKAWFSYTGLTLAQTEGSGWGAVVHPDDLQACLERWTRSFTTGEDYEIEYRFKRGADGAYRWFLGRATARRNEAGKILQWVGTCTDIDDQKRAHSELENRVAARTAELAISNATLLRQQTELRVLFDYIPAMICFKDTRNGILRVNKRLAEHFGKSVGEIEGKAFPEILPKEADGFYGNDLEVIRSGLPKLGIIESARGPAGEELWIQKDKVPVRDKDGQVSGVVVMAQDITGRRRADEALRLLGSAVEQSKESILITDAEIDWPGPKIIFVNPAFTKMTGYTAEEVIGKTPRLLQGPRTDEAVLGRLRKNLERGEVFEGEAVNYRKDGTEFILEWQIAPLREASGKTTHFVAIQRDITIRKQIAEALQRQQTELRVLFDLMPAMIWFKDTENRILRINQRVAEAAGKSIAEIEGRPSVEIYPREAAKYFRDDLEVIHSGVPKLGFIEILHNPGGTETWVQTDKVPVRDQEGKITGIVVMARDITETKRVEEALRESEKRFKALFEQAAVGVAQVDATTGRFVQINQRFCEMMGHSHQELERLTFSEITHAEDVGSSLESTRQMKVGVIREFTQEKRYLRKDRSELWASVTISAMWAPGETPDYFIAVVQDVTERKRLEEQFRQAQKMEAIGTLAGGIAHDFNNILTAIVGYAGLARLILKENPEVREHLDAVLQSASRATDLVRQILAFSRQQRLERHPIQLQPVVIETLQLLRATIPSTIEFDLAIAADAPAVLADATQIHQILMNLGTNAWHAMKERPGRLQVKLEKCLVDAVMAATQPRLRPGLYARLSIGDAGCGMDEATQRRIFEPFFTTKPPGEGTGLGLAVVHGIIDSHDGVVTVHSRLGEGTTFQLYFPAHAGGMAVPVAIEGQVPRGHGERVLFVDDEELLVRLGQKTLATLGYEVEVATQPAVALTMVRADPGRFALVFTDLTMPGMTGLQLADQLLKIRPGLPIILMTGYSASLTPAQIEAAGLRQLLLKPTTLHSLGAAVHAALSNQLHR